TTYQPKAAGSTGNARNWASTPPRLRPSSGWRRTIAPASAGKPDCGRQERTRISNRRPVQGRTYQGGPASGLTIFPGLGALHATLAPTLPEASTAKIRAWPLKLI